MTRIGDILASMTQEDWDKLAEKFEAQQTQLRKEKNKFYVSAKCQHIIDQIISTGESMDNETVSYFYESTCERLKLVDVSEEDLGLFFTVMGDPHMDATIKVNEDESNPWPNCYFDHRCVS